ncbi:TBC1 domain family member 24-like isoform X2 [Betta splendens]|uniref:TBC1 domain family member 24 n=1 Tax=Betta splendens TaxID=158456 RepID=A0A9W2Y2X6_BETSP|nr:TBC1 domain family member 24-like isoform X2 [Betta splendens]
MTTKVCTSSGHDPDSLAGGRIQHMSLSQCSLQDPKNYGAKTEDVLLRPRSRSFYSYDTSTLDSDCDVGNESNPGRQRSNSLHHELHGSVISEKSKSKPNKLSTSREPKGTKANVKPVAMLTISELDNWEISSGSGLKYGQFVDWERIHPEAAQRYRQILKSGHRELKRMARDGFWTAPHTLRAKAYHHIIHSFNYSTSVTPDRDVYHELANKLFGEHKTSSHPVPEYMEAEEIPRYCLNKAGRNSAKKVLLCLGKSFPDINHCPVLPALVALVLHFSQDEADCFHSVSKLICYDDPDLRYVDRTFLTYHASCMTFGDLANRCCRGIRKLIASSHQSLFEFYSDWIMWTFADLPFTYAIRVLDVYLLEGYKILYRVALALLSLYKASVSSRVADVENFRTDMKGFVQNIERHCTTEQLLERAFVIPVATRRDLDLLFNANIESLMQKGISSNQKRQSVETVDFSGFSSSVVTGSEMSVVWAWIPERFALFSPIRLFSTAEHGRSLVSFYSHVEGHHPAILIIKTEDEEVFGAFLSTDLTERHQHDSEQTRYFGTGECFVFTLRPCMERYQQPMVSIMTRGAFPRQDPRYLMISGTGPTQYQRTAKISKRPKEQEASMFLAASDSQFIIGGDGGHALCLQEDLTAGYSEACDTFKSIPFCKGQFRIQSLEVWGIQHSISLSHCFPSQ